MRHLPVRENEDLPFLANVSVLWKRVTDSFSSHSKRRDECEGNRPTCDQSTRLGQSWSYSYTSDMDPEEVPGELPSDEAPYVSECDVSHDALTYLSSTSQDQIESTGCEGSPRRFEETFAHEGRGRPPEDPRPFYQQPAPVTSSLSPESRPYILPLRPLPQRHVVARNIASSASDTVDEQRSDCIISREYDENAAASPVETQPMSRSETSLQALSMDSLSLSEYSDSESDDEEMPRMAPLHFLRPVVKHASRASLNMYPNYYREHKLQKPAQTEALTGDPPQIDGLGCAEAIDEDGEVGSSDKSSLPKTVTAESESQGAKNTPSKRPRGAPEGDGYENQDDPPKRPSKQVRADAAEGPCVNMACPFWKYDRQKNNECSKLRLNGISRVKQHLRRRHKVDYHCQRCMQVFEDSNSQKGHFMEGCEFLHGAQLLGGISDQQQLQLARKSKASETPSQQWFTIWKILFGEEVEPPTSPFMEPDLSQDLCDFRGFFQEEGGRILDSAFRVNGLELRSVSGDDVQLAMNEVLRMGLDKIYDAWLQRRAASAAEAKRRLKCRTSSTTEISGPSLPVSDTPHVSLTPYCAPFPSRVPSYPLSATCPSHESPPSTMSSEYSDRPAEASTLNRSMSFNVFTSTLGNSGCLSKVQDNGQPSTGNFAGSQIAHTSVGNESANLRQPGTESSTSARMAADVALDVDYDFFVDLADQLKQFDEAQAQLFG